MTRQINTKLLFTTILFSLLFLSAVISVIGYPNDLSINEPNNNEILPENQSGSMGYTLYGDGNWISGTSANSMISTTWDQGYESYIPRYDYTDAQIRIDPRYYYLDSTTHSTFTYTDSTYKDFNQGTYDYVTDVRSRANRIDYTTRYSDISIRGVTLQSDSFGGTGQYQETYTNPNYKSLLQDNDLDYAVLHTYSHASAGLGSDNAEVESTVDICIEIENTDHNLDWYTA